MKKIVPFLILASSLCCLSSCDASGRSGQPILEGYSIHHDDEFGGAYIDISIEEFNKKGFAFGDSISLSFATGEKTVTFEDIGYYSGYYVPAGQELVVGYKGYDYIKFCINYGEDVYVENGFAADTKVTITEFEKGKYKDVEETLSISYSDDRTKYESDEQFANFREVNVGRIAPKTLYRGASPVDDSRSRAEIVDSLLERNGIAYDIDLADKESNVLTQPKFKIGTYMKGLMDRGDALFLGMAAAYKAEDFSNKMKTLFEGMLAHDGPYYVHCLEGKDRTGYVCMVLEALCGADYDELVADYFVTYKNYYGIEAGSDKYNVIKEMHIDEMIRYVFSFDESVSMPLLTASALHSKANGYLLNIGLSQDQIDALQNKLVAY